MMIDNSYVVTQGCSTYVFALSQHALNLSQSVSACPRQTQTMSLTAVTHSYPL